MIIHRRCPHCNGETFSALMFDDYCNPVYMCNVCGVVSEDRDWFWTVTSKKRLMQILEEKKPDGLFMFDTGIEVIGIENRNGISWYEEFPDVGECMVWLAGERM